MAMTPDQAMAHFEAIYSQFTNIVEMKDGARPKIAHYTKLETLEKIFANREMWFSCPLFMNDHQEMSWGIQMGLNVFNVLFCEDVFTSRIGGLDQSNMLRSVLQGLANNFFNEHALNVFVLCFSEHHDNDGLLSMWRGYGGNGYGAAIVFDTKFMSRRDESPLLIGKVVYRTNEERIEWLRILVAHCRGLIINGSYTVEETQLLVATTFELIKGYALVSKHKGFSEEQEWRVIYRPERDQKGYLTNRLGYLPTDRGMEPKLRFEMKPLPFENLASWTLEEIVEHVIVGPNHHSTLAAASIRRMFATLGMPSLINKVIGCGIPFRPT